MAQTRNIWSLEQCPQIMEKMRLKLMSWMAFVLLSKSWHYNKIAEDENMGWKLMDIEWFYKKSRSLFKC